MIIRDARPEDAPFLAKYLVAGMHFYDFETEIPENKDIYLNLVDCERRTDLLYSYKDSRVAEVDGKVVGSLLSYPGDNYKELRRKSFADKRCQCDGHNAENYTHNSTKLMFFYK